MFGFKVLSKADQVCEPLSFPWPCRQQFNDAKSKVSRQSSCLKPHSFRSNVIADRKSEGHTNQNADA